MSITFPLGEADSEGEIEGEVPGAEGDMNVD
jgi:hypothetical protein